MRRQWTFLVPLLGVLVVLSIAATCTADDDAVQQTAVATTVPTSAATFEIETPESITPTPAAQAGREDCPQDWAAYNDPDGYFSICYPMDWGATVSEPQAYFGYALSLRAPVDPVTEVSNFSLTLYWSRSKSLDTSVRDDRCDLGIWEDYREITLEIAGQSVVACTGKPVGFGEPPPGYDVRTTWADIPLPADEGFVVISFRELLEEGGPTNIQLTSSLDSLRTRQ
ncbi:MAG: hypothetical protein WBD55_10985 [Dehalococcoidia bacterium]